MKPFSHLSPIRPQVKEMKKEETTWYDNKKFSVTVFQDPYDKKVFHVSVSVIPVRSNGRYKITRVTVQEDGVNVLPMKGGDKRG